jgi:uncharacterized membrane-anchored protein
MRLRRRKFKFSHSLIGIIALLILEAFFVAITPMIGIAMVLLGALAGGIAVVIIATDVIEDIRQMQRMLWFLCITVIEFIVFFAFQYHFLAHLQPESFSGLESDPVTLLLHSTMIFALNPLYLPQTIAGKALLLINTLETLVLALFVLQNIWQLHRE